MHFEAGVGPCLTPSSHSHLPFLGALTVDKDAYRSVLSTKGRVLSKPNCRGHQERQQRAGGLTVERGAPERAVRLTDDKDINSAGEVRSDGIDAVHDGTPTVNDAIPQHTGSSSCCGRHFCSKVGSTTRSAVGTHTFDDRVPMRATQCLNLHTQCTVCRSSFRCRFLLSEPLLDATSEIVIGLEHLDCQRLAVERVFWIGQKMAGNSRPIKRLP